jgi:hypothetical protein
MRGVDQICSSFVLGCACIQQLGLLPLQSESCSQSWWQPMRLFACAAAGAFQCLPASCWPHRQLGGEGSTSYALAALQVLLAVSLALLCCLRMCL